MSNRLIAIALGIFAAATPVRGGIVDVLYSGSVVDTTSVSGGRTETVSFTAGAAADKLVVQVAGEGGSVTAITYNGVPLAADIAFGSGRNKGIYYLDSPYTGGAADISVTLSGNSNGFSLAAVSLAGTAPGVAAAVDAGATAVSLAATADNSFVMAGYGANGNGSVTADAPLTGIYGGAIGSARGGAGYVAGVDTTSQTYSFTAAGGGPRTTAAAFAPADDGRQAITDLRPTGVGADEAALPNGTAGDPHYTLTEAPATSSTSLVVVAAATAPGPWIGDQTTSAWIVPDNGAGTSGPPGYYTAETTFTVPAEADLDTIVIEGSWAKDNEGNDILLNGNSLLGIGAITAGELGGAYDAFTDFSFGPGVPYFQYGLNTLGFRWRNSSSTNNPTGLRVGYLNGSYAPAGTIPEPSALAVALLGVAAIAGFRRRRTR